MKSKMEDFSGLFFGLNSFLNVDVEVRKIFFILVKFLLFSSLIFWMKYFWNMLRFV